MATKKNMWGRLLLCSGAASCVSTHTTAQESLEEVFVTAQRRQEASKDVPISLTTLDSNQLLTANVSALSDTAKLTPGLRFDTQGAAMQPTIRGVGTAITTSGGGPNVGIYVDGFFQSNAYAADFDLLQVENIQVLKGPQGTLFGRNTTGGAILVTTEDPDRSTAGEARISYGRFNAATTQGYVTTGIGDIAAVDVEAQYRLGDNHFTDILTGDDEIGAYESWSLRTGLKLDLSDTVSVLLRYTHTDKDDPTTQLVNAYRDPGTAGFLEQVSAAGRTVYGAETSTGLPLVYFYAPVVVPVPTQPGQIALNQPLDVRAESDVLQATIEADLGFANLTSYTQYREDSVPNHGDLDATAIPVFNILIDVSDRSFSQEFLLSSTTDGRFQWTGGLNYYQIRDTWDIGASLGGAPFIDYGGSTTNTKSYAAFLDVTVELAERWFLTAGGRYSDDRVEDGSFETNPFTYFYTGANGEMIFNPAAPGVAPFPNGTIVQVDPLKDETFTPRVVVRFAPNDDSSVYASFSRGYKAGLLNVGGLSQEPVKPEKIDAFEVGYKFDNRTLALDAAAFYYDYRNLQVSSFQSGAAQIRNAASSEIYGLEAQLRYQVSSDLDFNVGAAWTHARYKTFANAPFYSYCDATAAATSALFCLPSTQGGLGVGSLVQSIADASGGHMQRSPDLTATLGTSYTIPVGASAITLSGNLYYTSSFYFDPNEQFEQEAYTLLSVRGEWTDASGRFSLAIFGDNLTTERYLTQVLFNTLGTGAVWSSPAVYGVSAGIRF